MPRVAYVNGRYVPFQDAKVHIEDRGYQFADGVYEVIYIYKGGLIDESRHLDRLQRSLGEIEIPMPMSRSALHLVIRECIRRNPVRQGILYLQITRGVARRDHPFPKRTSPAIVITVRTIKPTSEDAVRRGVGVVTTPDLRWKRRDIKTISLLPNVLAKQMAREAGAFEAWLVDENGFVTEGASTNAWIITRTGELVTRQADHTILNGITRGALTELADRAGLRLVERPFSVSEAKLADEAFLSSTTSFAMPITTIDGAIVADGKPGEHTLQLRALYESVALEGNAS